MVNRIHYVLFVDDDPADLQGLHRSMKALEDIWNSDFASTPKEVFEKLGRQSIDAIVTDMDMPGMDGNQLLDLVRQTNPSIMRFVLSGNITDTQVMRSTSLVHQVIAKPCSPEHIFNVVERACRLRDLLTEPQLLRIITGIKNLPSVPVLYNRLLKELESPNASTQSVGNIIAQDTAMTAKILQLVNSAFFGLSDSISSPQRAVSILGLNTVKALVLGIHVFSEYQGKGSLPISIDAIWKHSMLVSNLAFNMAKKLLLPTQVQENARVTGILHDVGKLVLLNIPDFFTRVSPGRNGVIPLEVEYKNLMTSHAEMGGYLLGMWGLPNPIVDATTYHHKPYVKVSEKADLLTVIYAANGLANMCHNEMHIKYNEYLDLSYLERVGVINHLEEWTTMAFELTNNVNISEGDSQK